MADQLAPSSPLVVDLSTGVSRVIWAVSGRGPIKIKHVTISGKTTAAVDGLIRLTADDANGKILFQYRAVTGAAAGVGPDEYSICEIMQKDLFVVLTAADWDANSRLLIYYE